MNKLTIAKKAEVIGLLCEGMSMPAITRTTALARRTISELLQNVDKAACGYHAKAFVNLGS